MTVSLHSRSRQSEGGIAADAPAADVENGHPAQTAPVKYACINGEPITLSRKPIGSTVLALDA
jgi:hypothetical protein